MNKNKKLIILIDGNSYLYKSYYSCMPLNINTKKPLGAIYGMLNILKNILLIYKPNKLIIIFDSHKNNFRKKIFSEYKNNRPKIPYHLKIQIPILYKIIKNIGIPILIIPNVEADDVIGTLSIIFEKKGKNVLIGTADKDFAQLVTKNIKILNNTNNIIFGPSEIKKKYGVPPKLIIDLLSLIGDPVDNIPGIFGIGKKIATSLLLNIGSLKKIYENLNQILLLPIRGKKNIIKKLSDGKKKAFLSYQLATIKINVNIQQNFKKLKLSNDIYLNCITTLKILKNIINI